jgi:quercetin dioxygenase-like cupin family protein
MFGENPHAFGHVRPGREGQAQPRGHSGIAAEIIAGGDGAMTIMLMTVSPGHGAPPHISLDEDKVFLVSKGIVTFRVQDTSIEAKAGDRIAVGRGDVHGFTNRCTLPATVLLVSSPARHDRFFRAMAALPLPHQAVAVAAVCQRFNQVIVGPLVDS